MTIPTGCFYFGPPDICPECGGGKPEGIPFCSPECAAERADRVAAHDAMDEHRRRREGAFGAEVARLRGEGYSYEEIETMLAGMPS